MTTTKKLGGTMPEIVLDDMVRLADGHFGIVIRLGAQVGVQVPGEEEIRWISPENLTHDGNGAWTERKP